MSENIKDYHGLEDLLAIGVFESKIGYKLPVQYSKFLEKYNGGYPEPDGFLFEDKSDGSSIDRFLILGSDEKNNNLERYFEQYRSRIPEGLLPIARDPGGNLILIGLIAEAEGGIYFWDHETEADETKPDMSNVFFIAKDLNQFFSKLYEIDALIKQKPMGSD
jgi:hypothetical protein